MYSGWRPVTVAGVKYLKIRVTRRQPLYETSFTDIWWFWPLYPWLVTGVFFHMFISPWSKEPNISVYVTQGITYYIEFAQNLDWKTDMSCDSRTREEVGYRNTLHIKSTYIIFFLKNSNLCFHSFFKVEQKYEGG